MDDSLQFAQLIEANITLIAAVVMFIAGMLVSFVIYSRPLQEAQHKLERLEMKKENEALIHEARLQMIDETQDQFYNAFSALSHQALQKNNTQFLQLAQETLGRFQDSAKHDLDHRKEAVENLISPIKEALAKTESQVQKIEKDRVASFSSLSQQLNSMASEQDALRLETRKLVSALKRPEVRGQWGEISLKRIAELSGMVEYCDFHDQVHKNDGERVVRPDMVVNMPDERQLIIDAKTPMDAYLDAFSEENDQERKKHMLRHAKIVRDHMKVLAGKRYWEQFEQAPDFVILFIPGEQFLSAALEHDKQLLSDSLSERVILSSPSSLIALLRAVAFGWKQVALAENAGKIRELGEELYKRVAIYTEHMSKLGKSLNTSVENYNRAIGSLERNVLPGARRFSDLGIQEKKPLAKTDMIENVARMPVDSDR